MNQVIITEKRSKTMKKAMDYIYKEGDIEILIETVQRDTRADMIAQYVKCRKNKKITQEELARRAGIPRTNITRFESGTYNPSLEMMVKIAAALEMKLEIGLKEL